MWPAFGTTTSSLPSMPSCRTRAARVVVVGDHDLTTTPRAARVLHDGIPGSELVVIENAGHMSFVEEQQPYLNAVRDFLRRKTATK